jgi:hypothetical protein
MILRANSVWRLNGNPIRTSTVFYKESAAFALVHWGINQPRNGEISSILLA